MYLRLVIVALFAALLFPLAAWAERAQAKPPVFPAGREYHAGHSARPHRVKPRKRKAQRRQTKKTGTVFQAN